jgi:hypothetical protein
MTTLDDLPRLNIPAVQWADVFRAITKNGGYQPEACLVLTGNAPIVEISGATNTTIVVPGPESLVVCGRQSAKGDLELIPAHHLSGKWDEDRRQLSVVGGPTWGDIRIVNLGVLTDEQVDLVFGCQLPTPLISQPVIDAFVADMAARRRSGDPASEKEFAAAAEEAFPRHHIPRDSRLRPLPRIRSSVTRLVLAAATRWGCYHPAIRDASAGSAA